MIPEMLELPRELLDQKPLYGSNFTPVDNHNVGSALKNQMLAMLAELVEDRESIKLIAARVMRNTTGRPLMCTHCGGAIPDRDLCWVGLFETDSAVYPLDPACLNREACDLKIAVET